MVSSDFQDLQYDTVRFITVLLLFASTLDFLIIGILKLLLLPMRLFRIYTIFLMEIPVSQKRSRYALTVCSGFIF